MEVEDDSSLEYTPTWIVAVVCTIIVSISLIAERLLHRIGKYFQRTNQEALFEALQKLKEELMLLGFISLILTAFQTSISHVCIPTYYTNYMLPCKKEHSSSLSDLPTLYSGRHLLSADSSDSNHCALKGKVPLLSLEALHQLHVFIFVLALVHVIFCVITMLLGRARIQVWKHWENSIRSEKSPDSTKVDIIHGEDHNKFIHKHTEGYWRKAAVISWMRAFAKQFHGSIAKSDYIALRDGFIKEHCPSNLHFDFHKYVTRTLEVDFKRVVGISWYLWLFVVFFLLINLEGWHTYFWLSFLPVILVLLVGAKLEHIITRLGQEALRPDHPASRDDDKATRVKPSDEYFWFGQPIVVLHLIHFILFQNSFELAFFFWVWVTYGFRSCIMEKLGYVITRLVMGLIVQVLCSYITLPLYAFVTQMGSTYKQGMFPKWMESVLRSWLEDVRKKRNTSTSISS